MYKSPWRRASPIPPPRPHYTESPGPSAGGPWDGAAMGGLKVESYILLKEYYCWAG